MNCANRCRLYYPEIFVKTTHWLTILRRFRRFFDGLERLEPICQEVNLCAVGDFARRKQPTKEHRSGFRFSHILEDENPHLTSPTEGTLCVPGDVFRILERQR